MLRKVEPHGLIQWDRREVLFAHDVHVTVGDLSPEEHCWCAVRLSLVTRGRNSWSGCFGIAPAAECGGGGGGGRGKGRFLNDLTDVTRASAHSNRIINTSGSIHLDVAIQIFAKQCFQRCHPDLLVQRQLSSSVVASVATLAAPLLELFNIVSQVPEIALHWPQNFTEHAAGSSPPLQGHRGGYAVSMHTIRREKCMRKLRVRCSCLHTPRWLQ